MTTPYEFATSDQRPATCYQSDIFLVGRVDGEDDYRIGCISNEGEIAKWTFPNSRHDVSFDRADLADLRDLLDRVLAANTAQ